MEGDFTKTRRKQIKDQNILIVEIMMYVAAIIKLFGYGGKMADFSTMEVSMMSFGGTLIFAPGPLFLMQDIRIYWKDGNPF